MTDTVYQIGATVVPKIRPTVNQLLSWKLLKKEGRSLVASNKVLMRQLSADAEKAGSAEMTLDEINAEIAAARSGK